MAFEPKDLYTIFLPANRPQNFEAFKSFSGEIHDRCDVNKPTEVVATNVADTVRLLADLALV